MAMKNFMCKMATISVLSFVSAAQSPTLRCDPAQAATVPSECDARGDVLNHRWENIRLNCSVQNALTINYSNYIGLPGYEIGQITLRPITEVKVECVSQDQQMYVSCSHYPNYLPEVGPDTARVDDFTFTNLNESGILPGWTCFVRGCYKNEIRGPGPDHFVQTEVQNCTLVEVSETSSTAMTSITSSIIPTTVLLINTSSTAFPTTIIVPTKEILHSVMPTMMPISEQNNTVLDKIASPILVLCLMLFVFTLLILFVLRYKKWQKARARKALLVLDDKDMVFDANHTPPVCIDKPPFNFSHRISVVSADLIQNLTPKDMALQISSENNDVAVTTDKPGDPPHYICAVQNLIRESGYVLVDDSNDDLPWSSTKCNVPEQFVELPAESFDLLSDSTLQLTLEDEMYQSITHDSLTAQHSTLTLDDNLDTVECSNTLQPELTSVNQITVSGSDNSMVNLNQQETSTASDYQPSNFNEIPRFSNVLSRPSDIIQLDQSANEEYHKDSLSQSLNYIVLTSQNNHQGQQISFTSTADMQIMHEDDNGSLDSGQLPPTSPTNAQSNELDIDSDKGSIVSLDLTGDISETRNYSEQLEMQQHHQNSDNGYL